VFSVAQGIFHPYYAVLLAPFTAALVGAGVATAIRAEISAGLAGAALLAAGAAVELVVIADYAGQLHWLGIALPAACGVAAVSLFIAESARGRAAALTAGVAALLIAPAIWAVDTLGYATQSTFPAGGPASLAGDFGGPGGGFAGRGARPRFGGPAFGAPSRPAGGAPLFGPANNGGGFFGRGGDAGGGRAGGGFGGFGGDEIPSTVIAYAAAHGGGTIAASSQSAAAAAILDQHADVAGIGGFTGQESEPSIAWLADEVASGRIRWVYAGGAARAGFGGFGARPGASAALAAAERACAPVSSFPSQLYDCAGRAAALRALS
jgi:hypothetical protein